MHFAHSTFILSCLPRAVSVRGAPGSSREASDAACSTSSEKPIDFNDDINSVGFENASGPSFFTSHSRCALAVITSPHISQRANSFSSVSEIYGPNALGIILTGMGSDGTKGLVKMHAKGSYVIGQDEATSVVYGMPKSAFEAGAVDVQLPIERVAQGVMKVCGVRN